MTKLLSDRGPQFASAIAREVYRLLGIRKLFTTAFHPQANGTAERCMQPLAQMLAAVVNEAHNDWSSWLPHVAFSHNAHVNASTGFSPFYLAFGREPRLCLQHMLRRVSSADSAAARAAQAALRRTDGTLHVSLRDSVDRLFARLRSAHSLVHRRHELHRLRVARDNAALADALRLSPIRPGDQVFIYREPLTHSLLDAERVRRHLSRKFLNQWDGPFRVLAVGPCGFNGHRVAAHNVVVNYDGRSCRIAAVRVKKFHDPTAPSSPPPGLPSGFARYLLSRNPAAPPLAALDDAAARPHHERHGVESILQHRVLVAARGRGSELQYRVRFEGANVADAWLSDADLEPCADQLQEYWSSQLVAAPGNVSHAGTPAVRARLRQARKQCAGLTAVATPSHYALPSGIIAVPECPPHRVFALTMVENLGFLMVWAVDGQNTWAAGTVLHRFRAARRAGAYGTKRPMGDTIAVEFDTEPGVTHHIRPLAHMYSVEQDAPAGSWFLAGSVAQVQSVVAA
jgi:hypothetical protein